MEAFSFVKLLMFLNEKKNVNELKHKVFTAGQREQSNGRIALLLYYVKAINKNLRQKEGKKKF